MVWKYFSPKITSGKNNNIETTIDTNNIMLIQTTLGIIAEQSKCLKLISELQGKVFQNKQALNKSDPKKSKTKIPDEFKIKC